MPSLNVRGPLRFLLDTGADVSCIMPADGRDLGIDYSQLTGRKVKIGGVGGSVEAVRQQALVLFTEDTGRVRLYRVRIGIMPDLDELRKVPSLLGQDILSRWRTVHDPMGERLHATVLSADRTLRI